MKTSTSLFLQENTRSQNDITDCIFKWKNIHKMCTEWKTEYMPNLVLHEDIHVLLNNVFWELKKLLNIFMVVNCLNLFVIPLLWVFFFFKFAFFFATSSRRLTVCDFKNKIGLFMSANMSIFMKNCHYSNKQIYEN